MKLKKGSAAAKAYMAKIRSKRKTKTKTTATKQATFKPSFKKKAAKKRAKVSGVKYSPASGPNNFHIKDLAKQLFEYQTEILNLTKQLKFTNGYKTVKEKKEIRKKITELNKIYEALKKYYFTV